MTKGMLIYIVVMGWTLIIMGGVAFLFKKKKDFSLLNGYAGRSIEDKQYLKESGYLTAIGNLIAASFWIFLITFIAGLLPIPYAFGIGMAVFIVHLLGGLVWVQRYEVPHKRKKMIWTTGLISAGTIIFTAVITCIGLLENDVNVLEDSLEVSGMYGDEWNLVDIEQVEMLDELPEIVMRTNGFSMSGVLKGKFKLEEPYGSGLLFINGRNSPYVAVFIDEQYVIFNRKDESETRGIYEELLEKVK